MFLKILIFLNIIVLSIIGWIKFEKSEANFFLNPIKIEQSFQQKINLHKQFNQSNKYNSELGIFIDFSLPSYENRFFLVNLNTNKIIKKGLVTHGQADSYAKNFNTVKFSNQEGSYCSSQGFYSIGVKYKGKWGTAYRLHGLEKTNDNALKRAVVLHGHECVPADVSNFYICLSQGCPTLNPEFFKSIQPILDASSKPILIHISKD